MVFGRKKEASDEGAEPWKRVNPPRPAVDGQFRQPTDVTWDPQGNIFISDGYINSRVAKFDKNGDWVKQWGDRRERSQGEFNTPHSIAADAKGNIYVADRGNRRIQVFDPDGKFLREIHHRRARPAGRHIRGWATHARALEAAAMAERRAVGHLHHARAGRSISTAPMRIRGACTSCRSTARCWACSAASGRQPKAVRLDSRDGVPVGERDLRRRDPELARAEADPARGEDGGDGRGESVETDPCEPVTTVSSPHRKKGISHR